MYAKRTSSSIDSGGVCLLCKRGGEEGGNLKLFIPSRYP